jgi:uncharacterized protein YprB with RNaseH-like and TPR domain
MSVKKRLQRLTGEHPPKDSQPRRDAQINELRRRIDLIMSRRPEQKACASSLPRGAPVDISEVVAGAERSNDHGQFFLVRHTTDATATHGCRCIGELASLDMQAAALLANDPGLASLGCTDALFLDTETTGLSGGSGTFAFLIGVGWFEGDTFVTEQMFARDFSEERAALTFLRDVVQEKKFLVTFNGKSFDVGLLAARYIMNRMPDPLVDLPHLDLLHPSRRLVGHRLDNSRLGTLEREILGLRRHGDIPGSEIPQRYFDWLRRRDGRLMGDIFEHNRLDVISMAVLMLHLTDILGAEPGRGEDVDQGDLLAAARLFIDRGYEDDGRRFLDGLRFSHDSYIAGEAGRMLSRMCKRAGRWAEAVEIWHTLHSDDPGDLFAVEELAKWYEHHERDFERALSLVRNVLTGSCRLSPAERDALIYRLRRLKRRLGIES